MCLKLYWAQCRLFCLIVPYTNPRRLFYPKLSYGDRLSFLKLPTLYDFIFGLSKRHFEKIADDATHPLFNRVH